MADNSFSLQAGVTHRMATRSMGPVVAESACLAVPTSKTEGKKGNKAKGTAKAGAGGTK